MKIFKKLLSVVLASTMVVGMSIGTFAVPNKSQKINPNQTIDLSMASQGLFKVNQTVIMPTMRSYLAENLNNSF